MPALPLTALENLLDFVGVLPRPQNSVQKSSSRARRQAPTGSSSATAPQNFPPQYTTLSLDTTTLTPGTALATSSIPTSSSSPDVDTAQDTPGAEEGFDIKTITFGAIGGVLGLLLLSIIVYRLLHRQKEKPLAKDTRDVFWEKWRWGTYSAVHGDVVYANHDLPNTANPAGAQGNQGKGSSGSWWEKLGVPGGLGNGEKKGSMKKKHRARTLYKVKRLKRCGAFEIDSTTDLTSTTSR